MRTQLAMTLGAGRHVHAVLLVVAVASAAMGAACGGGDAVVVLPEGRRTTVTSLATLSAPVPSALPPLSISVTLADGSRLTRGNLIAPAIDPPPVGRDQLTTVCWFAECPLEVGQRFLIKHTTKVTRGEVVAIESRLDMKSLRLTAAAQLRTNDIGVVRWRLADPIAADPYPHNRVTGSLIVIDPETNATMAAVMVGTPTLR